MTFTACSLNFETLLAVFPEIRSRVSAFLFFFASTKIFRYGRPSNLPPLRPCRRRVPPLCLRSLHRSARRDCGSVRPRIRPHPIPLRSPPRSHRLPIHLRQSRRNTSEERRVEKECR